MRSNIRQVRKKTREGGGFWLSFSDMMSVLVLVFIFVIFSMMLSLAQTEEQYAVAKARMEASERELGEKETILIAQEAQLKTLTDELNGKTLLLTQQQEALAQQETLIAAQQSEIDERVIILDAEKAELEAMILDYDARAALLSQAETELNDSRTQIVSLEDQLKQAQSAISILRGNVESQKNQIVLLGNENAALLSASANAQSELTAAEEEKQRLSQRLSMLSDNAEAQQAQIALLLAQIEERKAELDKLGVEYQTLLAANADANNALKSAENVMKTQSDQLSQYETQLDTYREELSRRQGELEQMVGVKAQIIEALSSALSRNRVSVTVDAQTGAITLPSEMLFESGEDTLTGAGMAYLDTFLPVYMSVLMSDEFKPYVAEIIIEGHTDSTGKAGMDPYLFNLQLSQARALSVSNYVLREGYMASTLGLKAGDMTALRELITASGRSFSALVKNADGSENKVASRRVEIKFRLKDDETIAATEALLKLMGKND